MKCLQLDKMVGGLSGSKSRGRPPGQLPKANSLGDFNEAEEEGWNIGQMSDQMRPDGGISGLS